MTCSESPRGQFAFSASERAASGDQLQVGDAIPSLRLTHALPSPPFYSPAQQPLSPRIPLSHSSFRLFTSLYVLTSFSFSLLLQIFSIPCNNLRNDKRLSEIGTPPGDTLHAATPSNMNPSIDAHSTADSTGTFQLTTVITYILPPASSLLAISRTGHDHSASGFFMLALLLCLPCLPTLCFFFSAFPCTRSSELLTPPCTNDSLMH